MNRTARKALLVVLVLVVCAGAGWYGWRVWRRPPTIEEVGGTRLVYEIDTDRAPKSVFDPQDLAAALKRRLDPAGVMGVVVRVSGGREVEIDVPRQGRHEEEVETIKVLIAQQGRLEFCILANKNDDEEGIEAAARQIVRARDDAAVRKELDRRAKQGEPPPGPTPADPAGFASPLGRFTYSWVEVGRPELAALHLTEPASEVGEPDPGLRAQVADAREKGETVPLPNLGGALLYSRPCADGRLTQEQRERKGSDFFLLTRDPERDKALTGAYLAQASAREVQGRPAVDLRFNKRGGELLHELTERNRPTGADEDVFRRHLAVILDGQIMTAPSLIGVIGERAQITGNFTPQEVDQIVLILRAGALPAQLKPVPIREETVEPKAKR
jgi:preprotein translocase subunit SecD